MAVFLALGFVAAAGLGGCNKDVPTADPSESDAAADDGSSAVDGDRTRADADPIVPVGKEKDASSDAPVEGMTPDGAADASTTCIAGTVRAVACGMCGSQQQTCQADGTWTDQGACGGEGVCTPGASVQKACGTAFCSTLTETCQANCSWKPSACTAPGVCAPGEVEESKGGCAGADVKVRTCGGVCGWSAWSACGAAKTGWVRMPNVAGPNAVHLGQQAVWTGSEMFVIGGNGAAGSNSPFVAAYNPAARSWRLPAQLPAGRTFSFAAWTGTHILVWGGRDPLGKVSAVGFKYDLAANTWTTLPAAPLSAREAPIGVWVPATGELVVWGGDGLADGAAYKLSTSTWRTIAAAPIGGRTRHSATLAGARVAVFGGECPAACSYAGAYDASTDSWTSFLVPGGWLRRYGVASTSSGDQAYFWGGLAPLELARGVTYDFGAGSWSLLASPTAAELPLADIRESAGLFFGNGKVWVWGGRYFTPGGGASFATRTGASLSLATNVWSAMPDAPYAISNFTTVWTGAEALILGEYGDLGLVFRP